MLSRDEVNREETYRRRDLIKWTSLACVDHKTLTSLIMTASALIRSLNEVGTLPILVKRKERKEKLDLLVHKICDLGVYEVDTVIKKINQLKEEA